MAEHFIDSSEEIDFNYADDVPLEEITREKRS